MLPKLPLDLSTFSKLRELNYLYIDKTKYAYDLIVGGRRFFLSRPRRFGKTLFVSTLKEILLGNRDVFDGLWIASSNYRWHAHGLITLDLSTLGIDSPESLKTGLKHALIEIAHGYNLEIDTSPAEPEIILRNLVKALRDRFSHIALLVDEYDNPILQVLKDTHRAQAIRDGIRRFFAAIKGLDEDIDFVFITGVSSFAKAGLFSGMNNLRIITLDEKYASICGYDDKEIDYYFSPYIKKWAKKENKPEQELRQQIKEWYNGYRFGKEVDSVYNPFSLMNALDAQEFKNFWFQSGTPTFLVEILKQEHLAFDPDKLEVSEDSLGILDVGTTPLMALMFQAGYLTIDHYDREQHLYKLTYPNLEVKTSLQKYLLEAFAHLDAASADRIALQLRAAFYQENIEEVVTLLKQLFSKVPYQLHSKEEKYYHSLLIMACTATGIKTHAEYSIADGRIDLVLDLPTKLYIIEVKFNKPVEIALDQIKSRKYFRPFFDSNKPIVLLGLSFKRYPKHFEIDYKVEQREKS